MFVKKLRDLDQIKDEIPIVDNRILPAHNLSLVEKKMFKMKRFLGNFFPEKDQFLDFLCKNLNVDKDSLDQTNVNQTTFKNMITSLLEQVDQKVENRILQGFFSAFSYNKFGQANAKDIANVIFDENDKQFYMRVMRRPKGPPPCYAGGDIDTIALEPSEVELRKYGVY